MPKQSHKLFSLTILRTFFRLGKSLVKRKCGRFFLCFLLTFFVVTLLFRFLPIPFSAYIAQQKISRLIRLDFDYDVRYDWVSLDKISPNIQLAVIAAEDQNFPTHWGFDWLAIEKAFKHNETSKRIRGASTISQQTAKNLYLWHGQSWLRKSLEVPVTLSLELLWSKKRILEVYLNIAEFGNGIFGVEAASRYYFRKSARNLTPSEAALLVAVLPNPIVYKVNAPGPWVKRRQAWILRQMNALGKNYLNRL
ncbi:monofunctional biosynthetic peptidoglycan transglycosylase [Bisgaard Taxon 10/6]|uniref:monofunctional biosynthetic peptidoglycan transglycosylase n=1 Tax=Exercitatus varius TaxID=67857 RepID=UPI00294ADFE8|nr:monofunctional biosynthetic peptidoglycan transglycosylase [Exercitatus varius]MDG2953678.1 monofunctional biosynthetic peptidoglycan transglycosylase [Exercitatus varius]